MRKREVCRREERGVLREGRREERGRGWEREEGIYEEKLSYDRRCLSTAAQPEQGLPYTRSCMYINTSTPTVWRSAGGCVCVALVIGVVTMVWHHVHRGLLEGGGGK